MYVNLRRYPRISASQDTIERSVRDELLPELRKRDGFKAYCAFWDEGGAGVSVSVFEDQEAAHRSTHTARQWVMRHQDFFPERGEEFSGPCIAHEVSDAFGQAPGGGQRPPYVLVRELANLPGTQDTRAFVEQRTLPMITRSPGFRAVFMARNDRDDGRAAVVNLFDDAEQAAACHDRAVALLHEGLPRVTVTRVIRGPSVVFVVG